MRSKFEKRVILYGDTKIKNVVYAIRDPDPATLRMKTRPETRSSRIAKTVTLPKPQGSRETRRSVRYVLAQRMLYQER